MCALKAMTLASARNWRQVKRGRNSNEEVGSAEMWSGWGSGEVKTNS